MLFHVKPDRIPGNGAGGDIVAAMVTRIHKSIKGRLYLREHRKAKGVSAPRMAERMGMERESLLRLEREAQTRCTPEKQVQYADALGIEPAALWRPPGAPTMDELLNGADPDTRSMAVDMIGALVARRRS